MSQISRSWYKNIIIESLKSRSITQFNISIQIYHKKSYEVQVEGCCITYKNDVGMIVGYWWGCMQLVHHFLLWQVCIIISAGTVMSSGHHNHGRRAPSAPLQAGRKVTTDHTGVTRGRTTITKLLFTRASPVNITAYILYIYFFFLISESITFCKLFILYYIIPFIKL